MKETAKPFKTHYAQLKLLRKRGLEVPTDGKPMRALERIGYYTLINGYKTLFLTRDTNGVKGGFKLSFYGGLKMYDLGGLRTDRC